MDWKRRLAVWMQGRYGPDALYKALTAVFFALAVLNLLLRQPLLYYASLLVMAFGLFRVFSRNKAARAKENAHYLRWKDRVKKTVLLQYNRLRERKTHIYQPCPQCRTTLRLARREEPMTVHCPICRHTFELGKSK